MATSEWMSPEKYGFRLKFYMHVSCSVVVQYLKSGSNTSKPNISPGFYAASNCFAKLLSSLL